MSPLILLHIFSGLSGIASGSISVAGLLFRKRLPFINAVFLSATATACGTGFVSLSTDGMTSAQVVGFFLIFLIGIAVYARYARRLNGDWNQIYALIAVGALFLNMLITIAQSFVHIHALTTLAPTQRSPLFVAVKLTLLFSFIVLAFITAKRTCPQSNG